jgi:hypothetical protein
MASLFIPRDIWQEIARHCDWPELVALSRVCRTSRQTVLPTLEDCLERGTRGAQFCLRLKRISRDHYVYENCYPSANFSGWSRLIYCKCPITMYSMLHRLDMVLRKTFTSSKLDMNNVRKVFGEDFERFCRISFAGSIKE